MRPNLYHFICWLSHTSTSAIPSQNYISYSQMNHNHTNQRPGPFDLCLCHGKLCQSPKVTEGMATAVGSCWWLLLPVATRGIEGHAGDSASVARAAGHVLFPHPTVSQKTTHGPNPTLDQDFPCPSCISTMLFILLSSPTHCPSSPPTPHALFHYWPMGWNELHISSWKHGYLRVWRKKITQIIGTTAPQ